MKNIATVAICCAFAAAATGCAAAFVCERLAVKGISGQTLTTLVEIAITLFVLLATNIWSDRMIAAMPPEKIGGSGSLSPDHWPKVPVILLVACLTMTAATCAGHFYDSGGIGHLYAAAGLGFAAALAAVFSDLETAVHPVMLVGIFIDEAAAIFLATLSA